MKNRLEIRACRECGARDFMCFMKQDSNEDWFCTDHFIPEQAPDPVDYYLSNRDR